jgi:3-dehydroquinate synthase
VISRCIELKRDVVAEDEFDFGARQKLNLGHTFGHGIEAASNFSVTHGHAVAMGMAMVTRTAAKLGLCDPNTPSELENVLLAFDLPIHTSYSQDEIFHNALSDKKRSADIINLIIPTTIGNCIIYPTPVSQLPDLIKAGY